MYQSVMNQHLILTLAILIGAAFVPSILYLVWVRNSERHGKVSWKSLSKVFLWGAIISVIMAVILSLLFIQVLSAETLQREYAPLQELQNPTIMTLITVCVIAPIVEEFTKAIGIFSARKSIVEIEDGLVLGAASGLGFAAMENLFYEGTTYFQQGMEAFIVIVLVRSIASTLLHGSASAVAGYGISKGRLTKANSAIPYYLIAVIMHGLFNYLASFQLLYGGNLPLLALIASVVFSLIAFKWVRGKIEKLDKKDFNYYK